MEQANPATFNWDIYTDGYNGGTRLIPNKAIKGHSSFNKCYSRESYAQKLFNLYTNKNSNFIRKDLNKGDVVKISDILNIKEDFIDIEITGGLTCTIDLNREKRFLQVFGYEDVKTFTNDLHNEITRKYMIEKGINAYVLEAYPTVKISLWQGHLQSVREEFMAQIANPTTAYKATVIEANKGGFFVQVQGIDAFMPGSLAAPNKIVDFQSYIGKEIIVMVEDFLTDMNSFIVSHKKYLTHILPSKLQELDLNLQYTGTVTGCSKYGIFIEWGIFTGLLHTSKMNATMKEDFINHRIKAGDSITYYIAEIRQDQRVILTCESPEEKLNKIQNFILSSQDKTLESTIVAIMSFGAIVNVGEVHGLIPMKEFKKNKIVITNLVVGQKIDVLFDEFKDERIVFKI